MTITVGFIEGVMGSSLNQDQIEEILELYSETESKTQVAEETGHSHTTVRKYIDQAIEDGDTRMPEIASDADNGEDDAEADSGDHTSPFRPDPETRAIQNYDGMTPGDFITEFFDDFEVGIRDNWVAIQARRADRRSKLPTKDSLMKDLLNMNSGVNKSSFKEAEYIAAEYWAEAQNFLRATTYDSESTPMTSGGVSGQPGMAGGVGQQPGFGQEYVGVGGTQPNHPMNGGQDQMMAMLLNEIQQMRQEMRTPNQSRRGGQDGQSTLEKLKLLKQEKEILEEISGGDDRLDQIEEQLVGLQQQMLERGSGQQPTQMGNSNSLEERILNLAATDETISMNEVLEYLDKRESARQDPEVIKAKKEADIEETRIESEQERYEILAGALEDVTDRIGESIGEAIVRDTGESATPTQSDGSSQAVENGSETPSTDLDLDMGGDPATANIPNPDAVEPSQQNEPCPHCDSQLQQTPAGMACPDCQYGIAGCDLCGFPVEMPPMGEAAYGRCGECETFLEKPDSANETVECKTCEWEGDASELRGEALECDGCGEIRPIARQADPEAARERLEEITGD